MWKVNGRLRHTIAAVAAAAVCLTVWSVVSGLRESGGIVRVAVVVLALIFFWAFCVLVGSLLRVVFGEPTEKWTRAGMLSVASCAAVIGLSFLGLARQIDHAGGVFHGLAVGLRFFAAAAFWVLIASALGAIFGRLPEIEMAEGD
jgi:hypothetical protein